MHQGFQREGCRVCSERDPAEPESYCFAARQDIDVLTSSSTPAERRQ